MAPTRNAHSGSSHSTITVAIVSRASFYRESLVDRLGREPVECFAERVDPLGRRALPAQVRNTS